MTLWRTQSWSSSTRKILGKSSPIQVRLSTSVTPSAQSNQSDIHVFVAVWEEINEATVPQVQLDLEPLPASAAIVLFEKIGSGQFATVHRGRIGPFQCAVKVISTKELPRPQLQLLFSREIPILRLCRGQESILQLAGVYSGTDSIQIASELCAMSLYSAIQLAKQKKRSAFSLQEILIVGKSLLKAVYCAHFQHAKTLLSDALCCVPDLSTNRILHRDIKSHNVLLNTSTDGRQTILECKLGDFGLAKQLKPTKDAARKSVGSRRWMAPEMQSGAEKYDFKCDIWAIGLVLVEMMTLELPFASFNALDVGSVISQGLELSYRSDVVLQNAPHLAGLVEIVDLLLQRDPTLRPTPSQVLAEPMFSAQV